jgi:hypothetical protein
MQKNIYRSHYIFKSSAKCAGVLNSMVSKKNVSPLRFLVHEMLAKNNIFSCLGAARSTEKKEFGHLGEPQREEGECHLFCF